MKVKIGSYRSHMTCQIHYDYMNKKYGYQWEDNHNSFEHALEKLESAVQTIYNCTINLVFSKLESQVIKVRIDKWDTWSMDHTLSHIIFPMLKQLKETKHGGPYVEDEDVPENLRRTNAAPTENEYDTDEFWFDRWDWVLGEMIFAFDSKVNDGWEAQFETGESDLQWKTLEGGMSQMIDGPNHTKVYDWEGRKKYEERIANGFRLFGKYYQSLWD